jgi:flagellar hook-associated protein 2
MPTISIGGLATGLDTGSIIEQLVRVERRRAVDPLTAQKTDAGSRQAALQTFGGKLAALSAKVGQLRDHTRAIARKATTSDSSTVAATAGTDAIRGSTEVTVSSLARGSIAASASGKASATSTVASGAGSFSFRLGSGDAQTVAVDATTTLEGLATAINDLGAGVNASVVNLGTAAAPDYRLRIASAGTGTSNDLTIVADDTDLGIAVTQGAANASLIVSGFATPITRESNVVSDVIPGVTLTLGKTGGPVAIEVGTDTEAVRASVRAVVDAFNDLVSFVRSSSVVEQNTSSTDRTVSAGPLAFDSSVQSILRAVQDSLSTPIDGLRGDFSLLAEVGITSTRDGTLTLDAAKLDAALASDEAGVAELFGGATGTAGVFDRAYDYLSGATQSGGLLQAKTEGVASELSSLQARIDAAERQMEEFETNLRATFTNLEVLVSRLRSQSSLLSGALSRS